MARRHRLDFWDVVLRLGRRLAVIDGHAVGISIEEDALRMEYTGGVVFDLYIRLDHGHASEDPIMADRRTILEHVRRALRNYDAVEASSVRIVGDTVEAHGRDGTRFTVLVKAGPPRQADPWPPPRSAA